MRCGFPSESGPGRRARAGEKAPLSSFALEAIRGWPRVALNAKVGVASLQELGGLVPSVIVGTTVSIAQL